MIAKRPRSAELAARWCGIVLAWFCVASSVRADEGMSTPLILILQAENEYKPELATLEQGFKEVLTTRLKRKIAHVQYAGADCAPRIACAQRLAAKYAVAEVVWLDLSRVDKIKQIQGESFGADGSVQMRSVRAWKDVVAARVIPEAAEALMVQLLAPSEYVGYLRLRNANAEISVSVDGIAYSQKECVSAVPVSVGPHVVEWRSSKGRVQRKELEVGYQEEVWVDVAAKSGLAGLTWGAAGATAVATTVGLVFLADIVLTSREYDELDAQKQAVLADIGATEPRAYFTAVAANAFAPKARGSQASTGIMWTSFAVATLTGTMTAVLLASQNLGDDVE